MKVVSVNIGTKEMIQIGDKQQKTGILKRPTDKKVQVSLLGLEDDVVVNTKYHGGVDQAVYLYSADDYTWWEKELGTSVPLRLNAGIFGENLTLSTFGDTPLHIGDRFQIGAVILEVTAPRIPCSTLAARMGDPNFVKKFKQARRPGVYTRVIQTGAIQVGDSVVYTPATEDYLSSLAFFDLWYNRKRDVALIKKGLASPVAERSRERLLAWLS